MNYYILRTAFFFKLLIIFLAIGCQKEEIVFNDYPSPTIPFTTPKEVKLPLDSFSSPLISYYQIVKNDTLKFIFYNKFNHSLYAYDFFGENLIDKTKLQYDRGKLPDISAFYYINSDSILLFPEYGDYYYLCNEEGAIYSDKVSFIDEDDRDKIESHWISSSAPIVKIGSNIYINNVFGWIAKEEDDDKFLLIKHNLVTGSSEFLVKHPPSIYGKNFGNTTFRHLNFTLNQTHQLIIYSFNFDPFIYELSRDSSIAVSKYCAPENYEIPDKLKKNISGEEAWLLFQANYSFSKMIHDPYRKMLIRTALSPYRLDELKSGEINPENPKKPKLLLFKIDEDYKLLGEIQLSSEKEYYFINSFATQEGIWIQKLTDDENFLCFELINFDVNDRK